MNDMNPEIRVFETAEETAAVLADDLVQIISGFGEDRTFTIAQSGGTTPRLLFQALAGRHRDSVDWRKVSFFWVDERCVPPDDPESNYGMTLNTLLCKIDIPPENIHRVMGEAEPDSEALRYSEIIEKTVPMRNGLPFFDVVLLGLGDDGHTASIFPGNETLFSVRETCRIAIHPNTGQKRITITGKVINNAGIVMFFVSGKNKARIVGEIVGREGPARYPADYVSPLAGRLLWYLDEDAASMIPGRKTDFV